MKVFAYNPKTGQRGELLGSVAIATYADAGVRHLIETNKLKDLGWIKPTDNHQCNYIIHIDAGRFDESYLRDDQWVTFCTGQQGQPAYPETMRWEWVILPSKKDLALAAI